MKRPLRGLYTDYYHLTEAQAYFKKQMSGVASFEFFVREMPTKRPFLVAAGLDTVVQHLEEFRFEDEELEWLHTTGAFSGDFINFLTDLRFEGDVEAMPEGTIFFANEPVLRVTAPIVQAQLVETRIINILQCQILFASKAARSVMAAPGKQLVDVSMRRAHGAEASLFLARAAYAAGVTGTSNVAAGHLYDIPLFGTVAHSYELICGNEIMALETYAQAGDGNLILLFHSYAMEGIKTVLEQVPVLRSRGVNVRGVLVEGGDLLPAATRVRRLLDEAGLENLQIFASGDLDEYRITGLLEQGAPIDGFTLGGRLGTSEDAPFLNCAYDLVEYDEKPTVKQSRYKATLPGKKQVYRRYTESGAMDWDLVCEAEEVHDGVPLLHPVFRRGKLLHAVPDLDSIRARTRSQLSSLPLYVKDLNGAEPYPVEISEEIRGLIRNAQGEGQPK
jgi:nicotinate phosphoribosyltransferase